MLAWTWQFQWRRVGHHGSVHDSFSPRGRRTLCDGHIKFHSGFPNHKSYLVRPIEVIRTVYGSIDAAPALLDVATFTAAVFLVSRRVTPMFASQGRLSGGVTENSFRSVQDQGLSTAAIKTWTLGSTEGPSSLFLGSERSYRTCHLMTVSLSFSWPLRRTFGGSPSLTIHFVRQERARRFELAPNKQTNFAVPARLVAPVFLHPVLVDQSCLIMGSLTTRRCA